MAVVIAQSELHRVVSTAIIYKGEKVFAAQKERKRKGFSGEMDGARRGIVPGGLCRFAGKYVCGSMVFRSGKIVGPGSGRRGQRKSGRVSLSVRFGICPTGQNSGGGAELFRAVEIRED